MSDQLPVKSLVLHEDAFYEFFVLYRHPKSQFDIWGGIGLETFGDDLELVCEFDDFYLWTVVDGGDSRDQWIIPGFHYINRICYLVTEKPHNGLSVEFRIPNKLQSLTPLGLKRQMRKLETAMEVWGGMGSF
ncbi:hypothetical protein [Sulfuriferula thiophila]|uniref:hypothetical protein n=1 Tax=Sulfuriferula thiophila TaxID=1781211 RepID=UPI000F60BAE0|nr:hypothetical protein [Sulfuriferula thiophila]